MKQPLNEQFKRMQRIAGLNENQINEYSEAIPFDKWESALTDFIQKNLTSDIDEVENLNDVLRNIIATNEQELDSMSEEVKKVVNEEQTKAMDIPRKYMEAIVDARNALNLLRDVVIAGTLMDREMEGTFQFTVTLLDMLEEKIQGRRERF